MEQQLTKKEIEKLYNKKFPANTHIMILDKAVNGKTCPCICDMEGNALYYMEDSSTSARTDIRISNLSDKQVIHINEVAFNAATKEQKKLLPCRFYVEIDGGIEGYVKIDLLNLSVKVSGYDNNWAIRHSDRIGLGYSYKYSVFCQNSEVAHFRQKTLRLLPVYVMDYMFEKDMLFLTALFIIHSIYTNKKSKKEVLTNDRLSRNKGLFGL